MVHPQAVDKASPFLGEECALCKQPFAPGDELVVCPEDASRHHTYCWQANHNHCSAYGCNGQGEIVIAPPRHNGASANGRGRIRHWPRQIAANETLISLRQIHPETPIQPHRHFGVAQSCLVIAIAAAILIVSFSCFGLWAIADYIMMEILDWTYRVPIGS